MSDKNRVFCLNSIGFGASASGAVGLGSKSKLTEQICPISTDTDVNIFKHVQTAHQLNITSVVCGPNHVLFITKEGHLFSSGKNNYGQLGRKVSGSRAIGKVDVLHDYKIAIAACGAYHSVAVSEEGQCFTWGNNESGVLGHHKHDKKMQKPGLVDGLVGEEVVAIAAGYFHTIALTKDGRVYSWGKNTQGQLGIGQVKYTSTPTLVENVSTLDQPIAQISCGREHSTLLTEQGIVYVWGRNAEGQLGTSDRKMVSKPTVLEQSLNGNQVTHICCGENFTAVLKLQEYSTGLYIFGNSDAKNKTGCLEKLLYNSSIDCVPHIACGRNHVLFCTASEQQLFDITKQENINLRFEDVLLDARESTDVYHNDHSTTQQAISTRDVHKWHNLDTFISKDKRIIHVCASGDNVFLVMSSEAKTDNDGDLLMYGTGLLVLDWKTFHLLKEYTEEDSDSMFLQRYLLEIFSSVENLNGSFLDGEANILGLKDSPYIDVELITTLFGLLHSKSRQTVCEAIEKLLESFSWNALPPSEENLRICFIIPFLYDAYSGVSCDVFAEKLMSLNDESLKIIDHWLQKAPKDWIELWLEMFKEEVNSDLGFFVGFKSRAPLLGALKMLKTANDNSEIPIPCDRFYIQCLGTGLNIKEDFAMYIDNRNRIKDSSKVFFCEYPFLYDLQSKHQLLRADVFYKMVLAGKESWETARQEYEQWGYLSGKDPIFIEFTVDRRNIVEDTIKVFTELEIKDFKRPMKVKFKGEDAIDDVSGTGALRKEYFLLLMHELLGEQNGLFTEKESKLLWFSQENTVNKRMLKSYELVGRMIGLGIYNNIVLHLPFPLALFKKLLNKKILLEDLVELEPAVGRMLQDVLSHKGDDLDIFCLDFKEAIVGFEKGVKVEVSLTSNTKDTYVTVENRQEYVDKCLSYIFNTAVSDQFKAFAKGFYQICNRDLLSKFHAEELFEIVKGSEIYNWKELEEICQYGDATFNRTHPTVQIFWECFSEFSEDTKKEFLQFLTGTHKIPFAGLKATSMTILPYDYGNLEHEGDVDYLPEASTCYNQLYLPPYDSKTLMRDKLEQALLEKGFRKV